MSRLLWRSTRFVESVRQVNASAFATFAHRDFQYQDHSHSGTLLNRFTRAIAMEINRDAKIVKNSIKYSQFYPVQNQDKFQQELQNVSTDQLSRLLMFTANYRGNADIGKIFRVINELDNVAQQRIQGMEYREVQELMYMFMYLLPNKITGLDFIRSGIEKLIGEFNANETKENFLQICFYLGLFKKTRRYSEQLKEFLKKNLTKYLDNLDSLQIALVANSAFKASVAISDENFHQRLISEILSIDQNSQNIDIQLLVTFAKSLRHNRVDCTGILNKVQQVLECDNIPDVDLRSYVHLMALFVENRQIPQELGKYVAKECIEIIKAEHEKSVTLSRDEQYTNPNFRPKDLATFLWCITHLPDKTLSKDDMTTLTNAILWKLRNYEYKYAFDEFVDTLLSLVMVGGKSEALFNAFLNDRNFLAPPKNPNRAKLDSRQLLLTTCLEIEAPQLVPKGREIQPKAKAKVPDYLLEKRNHFREIGQMLENLDEEFTVVKVELKLPVQNINIPSYLVHIETLEKQNRSFWIEILDKYTTMADLETPTPIVRLKWRLLQNLDQDFIVVNYTNKASDELKEILRKAIKEHLDAVNSESDAEIEEVRTR